MTVVGSRRDARAAAGKKPKVIIVAVMRKMITTLNAMLRRRSLAAPNRLSQHSCSFDHLVGAPGARKEKGDRCPT